MTDENIISYYKKGFSIDYITKIYHLYKNRKQKPITLDGVLMFPAKIYTKSDCRLYVSSVIYDYLTKENVKIIKTTNISGRGAF